MRHPFLTDKERKIKIPPEFIDEIIIGYKMKDKFRNEILEIIEKCLPSTKVKKAIMKDGIVKFDSV